MSPQLCVADGRLTKSKVSCIYFLGEAIKRSTEENLVIILRCSYNDTLGRGRGL